MNRSICFVFPVLLFLITSCASLKLDPPSADVETILVLPVQVTNNSLTSRHAFYYIYEIVSTDDSDITYEAVLRLPRKGDMLIVDSLSPGNYIVKKFVVLHEGTGSSSLHRKEYSRNDEIKLESGKITIFSNSLNVALKNRDPGRMEETIYSYGLNEVTSTQKEGIQETLTKLPNFDKWVVSNGWKISGLKESIIDEMQGQWTGSWGSTTEVGSDGIDCGYGKVRFEITGYEMRGKVTNHNGDSYEVIARISEAGSIQGSLAVGLQPNATISGGFFRGNIAGGEISGKIEDESNCKGRWEAHKE